MKKILLPGFLAIIVMLAACKKDNNTDNNTIGIEGTYKFKYIDANTNSIQTEAGLKAITGLDYTTINNGGTVVINSSSLVATGLTYTVDTDAKYTLYQGSSLVDSLSFPFTWTLPESSSTSDYKLVGADSIYFSGGGITTTVDGNGSVQSSPNGGHYSWNGNLLTITENIYKDSSFLDAGETVHYIESGTASVVLEKQ